MNKNEQPNEISNKKCYSCGKMFRTPANLAAHKNRKSPCLIRNVPEEQKLNPNRCIFCNKIFSNKGNLIKHLGKCKIKNGGMDILDEKVRFEQELRIIKEQNARLQEQNGEMREQLQQVQKEIAKIKLAPQIVQNIGTVNNNNNNFVQNFHFYNYDKPCVDELKLKQEDLRVTNIFRALLEMIYFNQELPQNHTLYYPNIKEKRLLVYKNDSWQNVMGEDLSTVMTNVKNSTYMIGADKINNGAMFKTENDFDRLYPAVKDAIISFNSLGIHASMTNDEILEVIKNNKKLIAETLRLNHIL